MEQHGLERMDRQGMGCPMDTKSRKAWPLSLDLPSRDVFSLLDGIVLEMD
jgi:hypothetical protein